MPSAIGFSPVVINRTGPGASFVITGRGLTTSDVIQLRLNASSCPVDATAYPVMLTGLSVGGSAGARTLAVTADGVSVPTTVTAGLHAVCIQFGGAGSYVQVGSTQLAVAEAVSIVPRSVAALSDRAVSLSGVEMPNVSADASAFVMASSDCTTPSSTAPAAVGSVASSWSSSSSIVLTANTTSLAVGSYKLCVRWTTSSAYSELASGASPLFVGL